jgi:hypothetical protein
MINLPNIDGLIWDLEYRVVDILKELEQNGCVDITINQEGPCAESIGLYRLLDYVSTTYNIDKTKICIHTCNQLEQHSKYNIVKNTPRFHIAACQFYQNNKQYFKTKTFDNNFKTFGMFTGRSNWVRLLLASELYGLYKTQTLLTFHYDRTVDFHRSHCGIDELINQNSDWARLTQVQKLLEASPIGVDEIIEQYPITNPANFNISKVYHNFFCEIVCETYFSGRSFFPTEKIWRPIMLKTPFIVQGPQGYLDNLKRLGFQTFDRWWSEGYAEDPPEHQPNEIIGLFKMLGNQPVAKLQKMYEEMQPVLEHNLSTLQTLTDKDFKEIYDY